MNRAVELLRESKVFFLATNDGDQPKTRPFGAAADINGKVYICTSNDKECFKQMITNPKVEMAGMLPDGQWIRITGTVALDSDIASQEEFLKQCPFLANSYKAGDGLVEVLYFDSGKLDIYGHAGIVESINL